MHNIGTGSDAEPSDMQPRSPDPDRQAAEQLLDGHAGGPDTLNRLLAAARATGGRADQAGLDQALVDFAHHTSAPTEAVCQPKRSLLRVALARLAAAKIMLIVALAVIATGGIALAATTGAIPNPLPGSNHSTPTVSAANATSPKASNAPARDKPTPAGFPATEPAPASTTSPTADSAAASGGLTSSFSGLCKSWLARPHTNGKADTSTAFRGLIAAAGGENAVDGYCAALLAPPAAISAPPAIASTSTSGPADTTTPAGKKTHSDGKVTGKSS